MATFRRSTRVQAPLDRVWEFHSTADGLEALTPDWFDLRIEAVEGPDGDPDPDVLDVGATLTSSIRPFGVGPRQRWTSEIVERQRTDEQAIFRDRMVDGPFATWEHTHRFVADPTGSAHDSDDAETTTTVIDHVEYALPGGPLGRIADPFARLGFEPMFRHRHRRTRELLGTGQN